VARDSALDGDSTTDSAVRRANAAIRAEQASGRPGKRRRFRLSEWRLPTKLMVVLLVPTLAALAFAGLRVYTQIKQANDLDYLLQQVELHSKVYEAADQIQKEGQVVAQYAASGRQGDRAPIDAQLQATDDAVADVRSSAEAFFGESGESVRSEYERVFFRLDSLPAIREVGTATSSQFDGIAVASIYADIVSSILQVGQLARSDVGGGQLTPRLTALNAIATAKAQIGQQFSYIVVAAQQGAIRTNDLSEIQAAVARHDSALATFNSVATPGELQRLNDTLVGPAVDQLKQNRQLLLVRGETSQNLGIVPNEVVQAGTSTLGLYRTIETGELSDLRDSISTLRNDQQEATLRDAAIVLAVLLLAVLLALLVARSLLKPLRVLRSNALDVAYSRLPQTVRRILADPDPVAASKNAVEPVPVFTREETGQLARSFDAVQEQAVLMATEQALLRDNINSIFVNLSRRSQALVERQLSLIDRLEQDEQDPDQLASLFELDHLATRMRRNSESLLVLSGTGLSRQLSRPVPASDVVGAAVSEVEHYTRVEVASAPDVAVQGRAVSDLVHVIAELLDNATFFSEPEKKVIVRMSMTRRQELMIQITDKGVGMSEQEIAAANARLADPPDLDVAVTRRMGLYVVARLAKRHNITVRLRDNEDIEGGLVARILVPADLTQPLGAPPRSVSATAATSSLVPSAVESSLGTGSGLPSALPPPRNSGIAGAFASGMPRRLRPDGSFSRETTRLDRVSEQTAGQSGHTVTHAQGGNGTPAPNGGTPDFGVQGDPATSGEFSTGLFGPPLPETASPTDKEPPPLSAGRPVRDHNDDAPTERLPIYEAVLSQWFEAADTGSLQAQPNQPQQGSGRDATEGAAPAAEVSRQPEPVWTSPGDEGWQAAEALLSTKAEKPTTSAGLPKRVPKEHLVPGSAAPRTKEKTATTGQQPALSLPPRSADAIRGRMSSFQQGVRRGRHTLIDAFSGDKSGTQDQEQE
jgi:signal transduction histidine kinase